MSETEQLRKIISAAVVRIVNLEQSLAKLGDSSAVAAAPSSDAPATDALLARLSNIETVVKGQQMVISTLRGAAAGGAAGGAVASSSGVTVNSDILMSSLLSLTDRVKKLELGNGGGGGAAGSGSRASSPRGGSSGVDGSVIASIIQRVATLERAQGEGGRAPSGDDELKTQLASLQSIVSNVLQEKKLDPRMGAVELRIQEITARLGAAEKLLQESGSKVVSAPSASGGVDASALQSQINDTAARLGALEVKVARGGGAAAATAAPTAGNSNSNVSALESQIADMIARMGSMEVKLSRAAAGAGTGVGTGDVEARLRDALSRVSLLEKQLSESAALSERVQELTARLARLEAQPRSTSSTVEVTTVAPARGSALRREDSSSAASTSSTPAKAQTEASPAKAQAEAQAEASPAKSLTEVVRQQQAPRARSGSVPSATSSEATTPSVVASPLDALQSLETPSSPMLSVAKKPGSKRTGTRKLPSKRVAELGSGIAIEDDSQNLDDSVGDDAGTSPAVTSTDDVSSPPGSGASTPQRRMSMLNSSMGFNLPGMNEAITKRAERMSASSVMPSIAPPPGGLPGKVKNTSPQVSPAPSGSPLEAPAAKRMGRRATLGPGSLPPPNLKPPEKHEVQALGPHLLKKAK